jgi:hypothetical protein
VIFTLYNLCNEFIYIHINSRLDYLRFKLICLINSNDIIRSIINELIIGMNLQKKKKNGNPLYNEQVN